MRWIAKDVVHCRRHRRRRRRTVGGKKLSKQKFGRSRVVHLLLIKFEARGQFQQPIDPLKCASIQHLAQRDTFLFDQQNCAQLFQCTDVEGMPNFYPVRSVPYARVNIPEQKLLIKCWRN